jgi:hypothetical protein
MKKKFVQLFFAVMITGISVHAQQAEKFNPAKDKREINGYTVHLVPMPNNTFGFDIIKGQKPVYVQLNNPFSHSRQGFKDKDQAFAVAGWVINEDNKNGRPPASIPSTVAKQLNLQTAISQQ